MAIDQIKREREREPPTTYHQSSSILVEKKQKYTKNNIVHSTNTTNQLEHNVDNEKSSTTNNENATVCSCIIINVHWIGKFFITHIILCIREDGGHIQQIVSQNDFWERYKRYHVRCNRIYYAAYNIYL